MSSIQQKMYTHACDVGRLLSSDLPKEDIVIQIGGIVRDVVETVRKGTEDGIPMHVPAVLLSASVEFDQAYRQGGNQQPKLSQISEDDERVKTSSWCQPLIYARHSGTCSVPPIIIAKQPWIRKWTPTSHTINHGQIVSTAENRSPSFDNLFGRLTGIAVQVDELTDALKQYVVPESAQVGRESVFNYRNTSQTEVC